jgi:glycosyltransferase involved in cell wall biosynthesis
MGDRRACALIPVYNHPTTIESVCEGVSSLGVPVVLVDDGSDEACAQVLDDLAARGHHLVRLPENRGKGAAVRAGLKEAERLGFSHALQVDADGQHEPDDLPAFLHVVAAEPDTLVAGYPRYDESVSKLRFFARYLTHIWIWINTLSRDIRDSMCGVRLYPVAAVNRLLRRHGCGDRMSFDPEILVRWHWAGRPLKNLPVRVHYPRDGISHFKMWRDNLLITAMHTRLFFGMLLRLPVLLGKRLRPARKREAA